MNKFELFLKQSGFKDPQLLAAQLNNVAVNPKEKKWTFFISFSETPEAKSLGHFASQLVLYFTIPNQVHKVEYVFSYQNPTWQKDPVAYFQWVLQMLSEERASLNVFKNFEVIYTDGFVVFVRPN